MEVSVAQLDVVLDVWLCFIKKKNLYHSAICCLKYRDVPKAEYLDNDFKVNNRFKQRESIC